MRVLAFALAALAACPLAACHQPDRATPVYGVPKVDDIRHDGVGMFFDCDAAAAMTSEWSQPIGNAGRAQGALFIAATREAADWVANANVILLAHDHDRRVGFRFVLGRRRRTLVPQVRYVPMPRETKVENLQPRAARDVAFEIEWSDRHARFRVEPNAPWLEVDLTFIPERFALQCSTGETVFHAVSVTSPSAPPSGPQ